MLLLSAQHAVISKSRRAEREQLGRALTRQSNQIRDAFKTFLAHARSPATMKEARRLLEANDIGGAVALLDTHIAAFGQILPKVFTEAALSTFESLSAQLGGAKLVAKASIPKGKVAVSFDPSNPRAAASMRGSRLQLVQGLTSAQRDTTRQALANAFQNGANTNEAVKAFRNSIGLTPTQQDAVNTYEDLLRSGSKEALSRELRDRRYDPSVERATGGEPLDGDQIDRMVDRYRENMLNYRAENIARTESLAAVGEARQEATQQIIEQSGIDGADVTRTWRATDDDRTRDSHAEMDGQTVGLDEPFVTPDGEELMYPGDPSASAAERINCRCTVTIGIA